MDRYIKHTSTVENSSKSMRVLGVLSRGSSSTAVDPHHHPSPRVKNADKNLRATLTKRRNN